MSPKNSHVLQAVYGGYWAIDETSPEWAAIQLIVEMRAQGLRFSADEIKERLAEANARNGERRERMMAAAADSPSGPSGKTTIGVVQVFGVIAHRASMMQDTSGGCSIEQMRADFRANMDDPSIDAIVLAIDSPGGTVDGIEEFAAEIRAARAQKPIVAVADGPALSAAYYLASAAQEIVLTPSGRVGSVGVIFAHSDESKANEMAGQKITLITAGKFKGEGRSNAPLSEDALGHFQEQADEYYRMFVHAVARGRGCSMETVRTDYGQGWDVMAKAALAAGMVDRIDTIDNTFRRIARGAVKPTGLGPDTTGDAAASADSVSDLPALDPETVSAEAEEIAAMAQKHAAARATEGRPLSAADRDRLARARGSIDSLLAEAPAPVKAKGPSLALALAIAEAEVQLAGTPTAPKE